MIATHKNSWYRRNALSGVIILKVSHFTIFRRWNRHTIQISFITYSLQEDLEKITDARI